MLEVNEVDRKAETGWRKAAERDNPKRSTGAGLEGRQASFKSEGREVCHLNRVAEEALAGLVVGAISAFIDIDDGGIRAGPLPRRGADLGILAQR